MSLEHGVDEREAAHREQREERRRRGDDTCARGKHQHARQVARRDGARAGPRRRRERGGRADGDQLRTHAVDARDCGSERDACAGEAECDSRQHELFERADIGGRDDGDRHGGCAAAHETAVTGDRDCNGERDGCEERGPGQAPGSSEDEGAERDARAERRRPVRPRDGDRSRDRGHGGTERALRREHERPAAEGDEAGDLVRAHRSTVPTTRMPGRCGSGEPSVTATTASSERATSSSSDGAATST